MCHFQVVTTASATQAALPVALKLTGTEALELAVSLSLSMPGASEGLRLAATGSRRAGAVPVPVQRPLFKLLSESLSDWHWQVECPTRKS
jgi:hypothetical protein